MRRKLFLWGIFFSLFCMNAHSERFVFDCILSNSSKGIEQEKASDASGNRSIKVKIDTKRKVAVIECSITGETTSEYNTSYNGITTSTFRIVGYQDCFTFMITYFKCQYKLYHPDYGYCTMTVNQDTYNGDLSSVYIYFDLPYFSLNFEATNSQVLEMPKDVSAEYHRKYAEYRKEGGQNSYGNFVASDYFSIYNSSNWIEKVDY